MSSVGSFTQAPSTLSATVSTSIDQELFKFLSFMVPGYTFTKITKVVESWGIVVTLYNNESEQVRILCTSGPGADDFTVEVILGVLNQENGDQLLQEDDSFIFL